MDDQQQQEQQQQQQPGDPNAANAAKNNEVRDASTDPNSGAAPQTGNSSGGQLRGMTQDEIKDEQARWEKRRQAYNDARKGPIGEGIDAVNAFINAMEDCHADTPQQMLEDTDVRNAAIRAREGLKVFTGDTVVTFSNPTSDAHLNLGSGGHVTGNTPANQARVAAVKAAHEDEDDEELPAGVAKVPQPDAAVR